MQTIVEKMFVFNQIELSQFKKINLTHNAVVSLF